MTEIVEVRTGARLHFGLFSTSPEGEPFGGIGMMIDRPGFVIRARRSNRDLIHAPGGVEDRIYDIVAHVRDRLANSAHRLLVDDPLVRVTISADDVIPSHRGFGSGTQLAFAVAAAMCETLGVAQRFLTYETLGRGGRSAVGTAGFHRGGFLVDVARHRWRGLDPGVNRFAIPADWRIVVIDPTGPSGLSGKSEVSEFESLTAMRPERTQRLLDLVVQAVVPGLEQRDFNRFASGIAEFNWLVGEHFAPAQRGVYAHPLIRNLGERLRDTDWPHIAQSSWGPAAVVFCEDTESANELVVHLQSVLPEDAADLFISRPLNRGAEVARFDTEAND